MIKKHKCHGAFVSCVDAFRAKVKLCMTLWLRRVGKALRVNRLHGEDRSEVSAGI